MGEKDMVQKTLEGFNDVFADIVNVFLFGGREVVRENELEDVLPRSYYKVDGKMREQERDVFKTWKNRTNIRIAMLGIENQIKAEDDMPVRVIGYDGVAYRNQIKKGSKDRYPVITVVLYFGRKRWDKARSLKEAIDIPEELSPFVNDYKINLFEVSFLEEEQVRLFKSDFRFVADYFVQVRKNNDYIPPEGTLKHVKEVLELLRTMTKDDRIEDAFIENTESENGGNKIMGEAWIDRIENRGIEKGIEKTIFNILKKGTSPEETSRLTDVPLEQVLRVKESMVEA